MTTSKMNTLLGQPKEPRFSYPPVNAVVKVKIASSDTSITLSTFNSGWKSYNVDASFMDWETGTSEYTAKLMLGSWNFLKKLKNREISYPKWENISDEEYEKKINGTINGFISTVLYGYNNQIEAINETAKLGYLPYFTEEKLALIDNQLLDEKGRVIFENFDKIFNEDEFNDWLLGKEFIFVMQENIYKDKEGNVKTSTQAKDPMKPYITVNKEWAISEIFVKAFNDEKIVVADPQKGTYETYEQYLGRQRNPYNDLEDNIPF